MLKRLPLPTQMDPQQAVVLRLSRIVRVETCCPNCNTQSRQPSESVLTRLLQSEHLPAAGNVISKFSHPPSYPLLSHIRMGSFVVLAAAAQAALATIKHSTEKNLDCMLTSDAISQALS